MDTAGQASGHNLPCLRICRVSAWEGEATSDSAPHTDPKAPSSGGCSQSPSRATRRPMRPLSAVQQHPCCQRLMKKMEGPRGTQPVCLGILPEESGACALETNATGAGGTIGQPLPPHVRTRIPLWHHWPHGLGFGREVPTVTREKEMSLCWG